MQHDSIVRNPRTDDTELKVGDKVRILSDTYIRGIESAIGQVGTVYFIRIQGDKLLYSISELPDECMFAGIYGTGEFYAHQLQKLYRITKDNIQDLKIDDVVICCKNIEPKYYKSTAHVIYQTNGIVFRCGDYVLHKNEIINNFMSIEPLSYRINKAMEIVETSSEIDTDKITPEIANAAIQIWITYQIMQNPNTLGRRVEISDGKAILNGTKYTFDLVGIISKDKI